MPHMSANGAGGGTRSNTQSAAESVHEVHIPDSVGVSGRATPEIIAEAVMYLHRDGVIVLDNAIDTTHLDNLEALLGSEAEQIAKDPNHHFNFGKGTRNIDQAPPLIPELMYQDVWANPFACDILKATLGAEIICHYANGNTALPRATKRQPVHSDIEKPHPMFPFCYVINVPLCDVSPANGSTEFWLGSHRDSCVDQHAVEGQLPIKPQLVEGRRKLRPPVYPTTKKGSLIIRDIRLWHAGVPNKSDRPRVMLAFAIQPKWFQAPSKVLLPSKTKELVGQWRENSGLEFNAEWIEGDVDHRTVASTDIDFSSANAKMMQLEDLMHPLPA